MKVVFGYAERKDVPHAVDITAPGRTLCDAGVFWLPGILGGFDAEVPSNLCQWCRRQMAELGAEVAVDSQAEGTCPVCVGRAPLTAAGLVGAHLQWSYATGKPRLSEVSCEGRGQKPEQ